MMEIHLPEQNKDHIGEYVVVCFDIQSAEIYETIKCYRNWYVMCDGNWYQGISFIPIGL